MSSHQFAVGTITRAISLARETHSQIVRATTVGIAIGTQASTRIFLETGTKPDIARFDHRHGGQTLSGVHTIRATRSASPIDETADRIGPVRANADMMRTSDSISSKVTMMASTTGRELTTCHSGRYRYNRPLVAVLPVPLPGKAVLMTGQTSCFVVVQSTRKTLAVMG